MNKDIQFGIRIAVDGQSAVPDIERIDAAAKQMAASVEQAGRNMSTEFAAGAAAVNKSADAVSAMGETEAAAAERIKAMVAASVQQNTALAESAKATELAASSTRRASDETVNYTRIVERANAQMSQPQGPARTGSSVATEESQKYVQALQRQYDLVGKNASEIAQYEVRMLGGTRATQAQANEIVRNTEALRQMVAAEERNGVAADNFIAKLKEQTAVLGMSRTQLLTHQAAQLGVSQEAAPMIARLNEASEAAKKHGGAVDGATRATHEFGFSTAQSKKELIVLAHELSQSRFSNFGSSLMVLAEQTGAASALFSGMGLLVLGVVAAVGGLAVAMVQGAMSQKAMNNALIVTGNYAGETSDSLNALAHSAVATGGSIGEAKKAVTELAGTGKFTGEQIGSITEAVVALEHATGRSIEKTIKEFELLAVQTTGSSARATEAISRATVKLDDQYHFLTESIYEQIRALEKEGAAKDASKVATDALAAALKDRSEQIVENLGAMARGWNHVKEAAGGAWDSIGNIGKKATPTSEIQRLTADLTHLSGLKISAGSDARSDEIRGRMAKDTREIAAAMRELAAENNKASKQAADALTQSEGVHAASRIAADDVKLQKRGMTELQVALDGYAKDVAKIRAANPASALITPEAIAEHTDALTKAHTPKEKAPRADKAENTGLADRLARIQDTVDVAKAAADQLTKIDDLYHQAGTLGDEAFYNNRRANALAAANSQINGYDLQLEALRSHHNATREEAAKHQKQIGDILAKQGAAETQRDNAVFLLDQKQILSKEAIVTASDAASDKYLSGLAAEATALEQANGVRGKSKALIEQEIMARNNLAITSLEENMATQIAGKARQDEIDQTAKLIKFLKDENAQRGRKAAAIGVSDAATLDDTQWKEAEKSAKAMAQSMSDSFGKVGGAIGKMTAGLVDYQKTLRDIGKSKGKEISSAGTDQSKIDAANAKAAKASAQAQVQHYGDMAGAAKGFFKENSAGYKALQATERAFRTFEMAMSVESMIANLAATSTKTTAVVAGKGFESAAMIGAAAVDTSTTGVSLANSAVRTTASTIAGVAKAFEQLGVYGFIGAAAILAFMVGMGSKMSGGGGAAPTTFQDRQKTQGTGTVLGDSTAKSESMANSLEIMKKNSTLELGYQNSMLTALKNIESALGGAAKGLFQTAGLTAGSAFGTVNEATKSFWGSDRSTTITDTGVRFAGSLGTLRSGFAKGAQYEDVTQTSDGGWLHGNSSNSWTNTMALSAEAMKPFTLIFDNMGDLLVSAGVKLGEDSAQIERAINSVVIDFAVSTRELKGQDLIDALSAGVSVAFDKVTTATFPTIAQFQKVGEGLGETLIRVATNYSSLDAILRTIGATFVGVGISSIGARERLIDLVGGIDELQSQTEAFAADFLSDAERLAPIRKMLTEQMSALGLADVKTRDQYKDAVLHLANSGALATEAGAKQYAALLALAPSFAAVYPAAADAVDAAKEITDAWQSVTDSIVDEIKRIRGLLVQDSGQSYAAVQSEFAIATAQARAGDKDAAAKLPELSQALLSLAEAQASTAAELARIRGETAASLQATASSTLQYGVKIPGFAAGGDFGGGLRLVGENGPELEVTGPSRIYNAMQTSAMLSGGNSTELVAEMRAVRETLLALKEQSQAGDIAIAQNTGATARWMQRWDGNGLLVRADADTPLPVIVVGP